MSSRSQIDGLVASANAAHSSGQLQEAERMAVAALELEPTHRSASLLLAVVWAKMGRNEEARAAFEKIRVWDPASFEAVFWLSILSRKEGRLEEAIEFAEKGVNIRPEDAHALNNLGLSLLGTSRLDEAISSFGAAARLRPDFAPIFQNLGTALFLVGRDREAILAFERALVLSRNSVETLLSLGQALLSQDKPAEATKIAERAIDLAPKVAAAHLLMASALVEDSRSEEAEPFLQAAVSFNPQDAKAQCLLGMRLQSKGRFKEATERFQIALMIEPVQGFAYFALAHNNQIGESERPLVSRMDEVALNPILPPRERAFLQYGLGKARENLGEFELAMRHYDQANLLSRRIKFGDEKFDRNAYARHYEWLIRTYSEVAMQPCDNGSRLPILIVGMMRSGTTLLEQILSSHPQVNPGGERRFWPEHCPRLIENSLDTTNLKKLGQEYVSSLEKLRRGSSRVTDKMPSNYELLGPIYMALPNIKIVHMRRNPVDTCLSIYATPNRVPVPYAYDKENISFAYREYQKLTSHWKKMLPASVLLEMNYEDLIEDRETAILRLCEFLDLEWHPSLMNHESSQPNVLTPSVWQVRQPIYKTSVDRWKKFQPWIGEFSRLLPDPNSLTD